MSNKKNKKEKSKKISQDLLDEKTVALNMDDARHEEVLNPSDVKAATSNINEANFEETGFSYTLSLINGKHKMVILYCLMEFEPVRFNEMKRYLGTITDRTLSRNLKELEADGLVARKEYPQVPPKVEYSLTKRGKSLMAVLDNLCVWGNENRK